MANDEFCITLYYVQEEPKVGADRKSIGFATLPNPTIGSGKIICHPGRKAVFRNRIRNNEKKTTPKICLPGAGNEGGNMFAGAATLGAEHLVVLAAAAPALGSLTTTLPSAHPCNSQQVARSTYPEHIQEG